MSDFVAFVRSLGIMMDAVPPIGVWRRYPTEDHPRSRNGAVKYLGHVGLAQNHAVDQHVHVWRSGAVVERRRLELYAQRAAQAERRARAAASSAAKLAEAMLSSAKLDTHDYLHSKGFPNAQGLVTPNGALAVPMRDVSTYSLVGIQVIKWDAVDMAFRKRMLPGMRAKNACLRLGSKTAMRTWLVEGYATGLSVAAALKARGLRDAVLICFSAGNLLSVARHMRHQCRVFADNDESGTGERIARATGFPWCMSQVIGEDANDVHTKRGLVEVGRLMMPILNGGAM